MIFFSAFPSRSTLWTTPFNLEWWGFSPHIFFCMETSRTEPVKQMQMLCCFYYSIQASGHEIGVLLLCFQHEGRGLYDTLKMMAKKNMHQYRYLEWIPWLLIQPCLQGAENMLDNGEDAEQHRAVVLSGVSGGSKSPAPEPQRIHSARNTNINHFAFVQETCSRFLSEVRGSCSVRSSAPRLAGTGCRGEAWWYVAVTPQADMPRRACLKCSQGHAVCFFWAKRESLRLRGLHGQRNESKAEAGEQEQWREGEGS